MRYWFQILFCVVGSGLALCQPVPPGGKDIQASSVSTVPPTPPLPVSPVHYFRQLLAMSPAEQEQALAAKPEPQRTNLRAKIQQYQSISAEDRDAQLKLIQIRWYLLPLMKMSASERAEKLFTIPEEDRKLVQDRLHQWDLLPPDLQKDVLEHELTVQYFARLESASPEQRDAILTKFPSDYRQSLEEKLQKWRALPQERRQKMYEHFNQFFELPPQEKSRTLNALSDEERQQMEKSLRAFERLAPEQRRMCIESFRKFANMTPQERSQFFKNVERWKEMTPRERETWRNLVNLLPPSNYPRLPNAGNTIPRGTNIPSGLGQSNGLPGVPGFSPVPGSGAGS
jgi:hypothetical protein